MSIYFDYDVNKTKHRIRRAVEDDRREIEHIMFLPDTQALFGDVNIGALIELSALSLCLLNEENRVVGFIALSDHPNVSSVDPADWEYWISNMYQRLFLSRNTLFVHCLCCTDSVLDIFLEDVLISVFLNDCYLTHIVFVVPIFCAEEILLRHGVFKKRNCYKFLPKDKVGNYLVTAGRQEFCPKLKMRRAVEEDNDDVVEILDSTCPRLKELYGLYYISELIGRHPESQRKILVSDVQGRAVTVMCLNTDIDYTKLQKIYDLKAFNGLNGCTPLEKEQNKRANELLTVFGDPILKGKWNPFQNEHKVSASYHVLGLSEELVSKTSSPHPTPSKKTSKVNFPKNAKLRQSLDQIIVKQNYSDDLSDRVFNYSPNISHCTQYSVVNMLDDDPFDYDIVNIDQKWLKEMPSEIRAPGAYSCFSMKPCLYKVKKISKKPKPKTKRVSILDKQSSSTYQGIRNAFMIELFALRDDIDARYAFDMLEAAFDFMKEYDYCIIRIPTSERHFPLLQHFSFVPTRNRVCCEYALYIAHRGSVLGKLRVREAEIIDIPEIANLLHPLPAKETMHAIENMIFNNKENQAYVFTSGLSVVGIGILELPEEIDFLRGRFNLDAYQLHKYRYEGNGIDAGFANIKTIIMYYAFEPHYRFFTRELMRLSGNNTLMYVTAYRNKWAIHKGNVLVSSMIPLLPRANKVECKTIPELKRIKAMTNAIVPFSAWFIGKKFTTLTKVDITTRIVLMGASKTCLGFLRALLFEQPSTYLTFTDVTLISKYGLRYMRHAKPIAESMFLRYHIRSDKYLKSVPYTYYVNVVHGKVSEINLQEKFVTLTSGSRFHYDLLFLFFGKQYQDPNYMEHLLQRDEINNSKSVPDYIPLGIPRDSDTELRITCDDTPENVFVINHVIEAHKALEFVKNLTWDDDASVIVYGCTIHPYLCINALLSINVPPEKIIFVEPFPSQDPKKTRVSIFGNENVDSTVNEMLENLKITVYRSCYFVSWSCVDNDNRISHAQFISHSNCVYLRCAALFYYGKKGIDMRAFIAVHKSGLSYDGGIVIDSECRTRDSSVYAAGPHTRYHRRYYADEQSHKYYESYEIGFRLGERIRNQLDPVFKPVKRESSTDVRSSERMLKVSICEKNQDSASEMPELMELKKPKVMYCVLPGGLKYLEVRSPRMKVPHHYVQSLHYNGFVMETYKKGYFKIHLSKDLYVDGITCLSPGTYSLEKFKHLYGQSARVLKNVHLRYSILAKENRFLPRMIREAIEFKKHPNFNREDGWNVPPAWNPIISLIKPKKKHNTTRFQDTTNKVDDFYDFFESPWAFFLYHDQYEDLFAMTKELFPKNSSPGRTIKEALSQSLHHSPGTYTKSSLKKSPYVEVITEYVIDWLSHNDILLPMYLQPYQRTMYMYDLQSNPLFKVKRGTEKGKDGKGISR